MGYHRAGWEVTGVDLAPQPNYPFRFVQADALEYLAEHGHEYDAVHGSPPCQKFSAMSNCRPGLADDYPDLVGPMRDLLVELGLPWILENVPGSPLRPDVVLCGQMFGLPLYRHRVFELWTGPEPEVQPSHPEHVIPASRAGHWRPGTIMSVSGHVAPVAHARAAMGIGWTTREELAEAIPPAYTQYLGRWLAGTLEPDLAAC